MVKSEEKLFEDKFGLVGTNVWIAYGAFWEPLGEKKIPPSNYFPHLTPEGEHEEQ